VIVKQETKHEDCAQCTYVICVKNN